MHTGRGIDQTFRNSRFLLTCMALAVSVSGCGIPRAVHQSMVPEDLPRLAQHEATVSVRVDSDEVQLSTLPAEEFKRAIETAIVASGTFRRLESSTGGRYQLLVRITSLDAPAAFAWDRQVRLVANWELRQTESGQAAWKDVIATKFTTTTKDAWGGMERTKLSTEGAARANIREAVDQLGRLKLE